jgi:hypothetical protein
VKTDLLLYRCSDGRYGGLVGLEGWLSVKSFCSTEVVDASQELSLGFVVGLVVAHHWLDFFASLNINESKTFGL